MNRRPAAARPLPARAGVARLPAVAAALATAAALLGVALERTARAADPTPDVGYFRENVEPVVTGVCAQCHAGKGHGLFAGVIAHAPGAPFPEADSKRNYDIVMRLLVPGKPEQSKFLLKPLAVKDGGVKHEGGDRIFKGTAAYRAWVDFINGVKGKPLASLSTMAGPAAPASDATMSAAPGQPDFGFFAARVEPVLLGVCAQCHAGAGRGQFALVTHAPGSRFPVADHRKNFETVLRLLTPGKPELSKFLLKPLAERDGGVKHGGGDRITKGDANYKTWTDFINGTKGPPPPVDPPPEEELPTVTDKGLVLEAETGKIVGDAATADGGAGASGRVVAPGPAGGRVMFRFRAPRRADYTVSLRAGPGSRGLRLRLDTGEPLEVPAGKDGYSDVVPVVPLDGAQPLDGRAGRLVVDGETLAMDGRQGMARWLSPASLAHTSVSALVTVPATDEPGRDDAWILFDCLDPMNGKFFGLADAGRKVVMGVIQKGSPTIVKSVDSPVVGGAAPVKLTVDIDNGVAFGRVDGKPLVFLNLDANLGAAQFGFQTHGIAIVRAMSASMHAEEVHRVRFSTGAVFSLARKSYDLEVELLPQGAALDAITIKESAP